MYRIFGLSVWCTRQDGCRLPPRYVLVDNGQCGLVSCSGCCCCCCAPATTTPDIYVHVMVLLPAGTKHIISALQSFSCFAYVRMSQRLNYCCRILASHAAQTYHRVEHALQGGRVSLVPFTVHRQVHPEYYQICLLQYAHASTVLGSFRPSFSGTNRPWHNAHR